MRAMFSLAWHSAWNRRFAVSLVVLSIALSTFLLITLERVRSDVKDGFAQSVSGTHLIVGPRTGQLQLLLYAVFRLGTPTNNLTWASAEAIGGHRAVAWWIPLSLGDSYRGFPVLATSDAYFEHFRYGNRRRLEIAQGTASVEEFDAVLGAEVARKLGHRLGERITLSHGDGTFAANDHSDEPFVVRAILQPTGTPVDRTVHIGLHGMEALHDGGLGGIQLPRSTSGSEAREHVETPQSITAMLVGLKTPAAVFAVKRDVSAFRDEPLMAILPGVALDELWQAVGLGERTLQVMTALVAIVSLCGLAAVVLTGLEQRRRELAILRAVGAGPRHMLLLLATEGMLMTLVGMAVGLLAHWIAVAALSDWVRVHFGFDVGLRMPGVPESLLLGAIVASGLVASLIPAYRAYRLSLADGLSPRI